MANGLDELIDGLVADIAYAGETGLSVTSFIATVTSKLRGPQKRKGSIWTDKDANEDDPNNEEGFSAQERPLVDTAGVQLARKAWTWLANRPEILVGRDGSQKHLSLDDALALPESQPLVPGPVGGSGGMHKGAAPAGIAPGAAPLGRSIKTKAVSAGKEAEPGEKTQISSAGGAATTTADPTTRPRLYATERTIWNTVTGHGIDYKKVPPLEWKCLMGIASARDCGILQADLRALVNQDKRSVPKRTDFLAAKGYIVKRAILTRGNRTSILWLTEFAPVELHDGDDSKTTNNAAPATDSASSISFPKDLASAGGSSTAVDFSPAFLTKDLEPVPWRSRWLGDSIEFASFGQTILAIVKAWAVIRVIDLKQKLGIQGLRWQMRTLSRICREFVACGVLRFVAAVRRDEKRLFKDCMKFEREPTNSQWTMILASGRRRAPLTELLATQKRQRQQKEARALGQTATDDGHILDDDLDDEGDEGGVGLAAATTVVPSWVPEVPLVNQVFDFVQRAGPDGTTGPAVTRTTLGPSFARYVFAMLTDLAKPRTQPTHLAHFQLVSEPIRVGRNNAYTFKAAGSLGPVDSPSLATSPSDLANASASQTTLFFGFSTPTGHLAQQVQVQSLSDSAHSAVIQHPAFLRRQRRWLPPGRGRGRPRRDVQLQDEEEKEGTDEEPGNVEKRHDGEVVLVRDTTNRDAEPSAAATDPPRRKRGRPPKKRVVQSMPEALPPQTLSGEGDAVDSRDANGVRPEDTSTVPRPLVSLGVSGSLDKAKTMGRPKKSLVLDFCISKLRDPRFLASGSGYKDGAPTPVRRTDASGGEGDEEGRKAREDEDNNDGEALESRPSNKQPPDLRRHAVIAFYQGSPGRLTFDPGTEKMQFVFDAGSEPSREPMAVPVGNIVNEPSMRDVPGSGDQAFVFEARAWGESDQQPPAATWPFVFVLAREPPGNSAHAVVLLNAVINLLRHSSTTKKTATSGEGQDEAHNGEDEEEAGTPSSQPFQGSGRRGPRKDRKRNPKNPDAQEYVCETCEGRWKNLVGLRYHQRKSQTPCNPSYIPPPLPTLQPNPRMWKIDRKTATSIPATPSTSFLGVSQQLPYLARRLFVSNAGDSRPTSRSSSSHNGIQTTGPVTAPTLGDASGGGLFPQKRLAEGEGSPDNAKRSKRDDTEVSVVAEEQEGIRTPPALRTILLSSTATSSGPRSITNDKSRHISSPISTATRPRAPTPRTTDAPVFRMPAGTPNMSSSKSKTTKFVVRSQRTTEIIKYLVDRYDGVFPSERSLWYAVFGVYTRTFPSEEPPTFNVCKTAVKKLDTARELEEHTFGFRDAKGLFNYCRLVARPGVDLLQSESAKDFKMRLQQSFPQPYVPAEYAPTEKDLAVLRLWDRDGTVDDVKKARAKRGRRSLAPEIEVLNAPFYGKPSLQRQTLRAGGSGPLLIDYGQSGGSDDSEGGNDQRQQTVENRHNPPGSRSGGNENTAKRRKVTRFADYIAGNDDEEAPEDEEEGGHGGVYDGLFGLVDIDEADVGEGGFDNEDNIDPALRTRRTPRNPGLSSLPANFFPRSSRHEGFKTVQVPALPLGGQQVVTDCLPTFILVQPGRTLHDGTGLSADNGNDDDDDSNDDSGGGYFDNGTDEGVLHSSTSVAHLPPTQHSFVTKLVVLQDSGPAPGVWPVLSQTYFQQEAPASFTLDGHMPSRKALLRENLPRSVDDCVDMLRANQKLPPMDDTPTGRFYFDVNCCRFWELSQKGTQILCNNASVAPEYVFLNLTFPGAHYTAGRAKAETAEVEKTETAFLPSPALWDTGNQFTVESLPYGTLEDTDDVAGGVSQSGLPQRGSGSRGRGRGGHRGDYRTGPPRPAKYVLRSRREMTAYPQSPEDYIRKEASEEMSNMVVVDSGNNSNGVGGDVDWKAEDTRIAAFVAVKTLVGGLSQAMDWGLLMRLFPDWKLSALRLFWTAVRKQRPAYIDQLTQRFQQSFLEAYANKELPALDFDHVLAYDWPRLISWTVRLMRREAVHAVLPATREHLALAYDCVGQPPRMVGWREEYFQSARSMWNRLQDSASEAAALSIDPGPPVTPAEAAAASSGADSKLSDMARHMVARSWIRALCATPHDRYPPSRIKQKLLTLGAGLGGKDGNGVEAAVNRLLQTVITELQNERVLRRSKSVVALGGRMYVLAEAYGNTLEKVAQQDKFRQAWAFKAELDACFRTGSKASYEIPLTMNDDGMVMALINLQAHGRVAVQAIDAPHVPFGFEPGNYETRKFPKHYQRFRQRIVPTARYVFNEDAELKTLVQRAREAAEVEMRTGAEDVDGDLPSASSSFPPREMPVWRDFFGVLDRGRFAKLASAVVFSQATRGATPLKQTAAHLRPVLEPFEVQMLMDWAASAGILTESELPGGGGGPLCPAEDPVGRAVSEWWWLLTGQVYVELWAEEDKEKEQAKEREKWQTIVISDGMTRGSGGNAMDVAMDAVEEGFVDGDGDDTMAGALP